MNNEYNKELLKKYPFLVLKNVWTGEVMDQSDKENFYIEFRYDIPEGWWNCFGIPFLDDIKEIMDKYNMDYEKFMFTQVKEKFGGLRVYHNGMPEEWFSYEHAWEYISEHTCVKCGKFPVPMRYFAWISPYCDEHAWEDKQWSEEEKKEITERNWDGRLQEYLVINYYSKDGDWQEWIDMKPFYNKIGWKYTEKDLISKDEIVKNMSKEDEEEL